MQFWKNISEKQKECTLKKNIQWIIESKNDGYGDILRKIEV